MKGFTGEIYFLQLSNQSPYNKNVHVSYIEINRCDEPTSEFFPPSRREMKTYCYGRMSQSNRKTLCDSQHNH